MCGRFTLFTPIEELLERFDAVLAPDIEYEPRYNNADSDLKMDVTAFHDESRHYPV
jgi:putative SOS response-associated peptidase YedK